MAVCTRKSKRNICKATRDHDYIYDNTFIVPGEKDHEKYIYKAAIDSSETAIIPIFEQMFSELKLYPRVQNVMIPNAYLPCHLDLSYSNKINSIPLPSEYCSRDRFKFFAAPQKSNQPDAEDINLATDRQNSTLQASPKIYSCNKYTQTIFRESSTQTYPYQPGYIIKDDCTSVPEIIYLEDLHIENEMIKNEVDKSIVQWINRFRIKRAWLDDKPTSSVLSQLEFYEQIYRENEIKNIIEENDESLDNLPEPLSQMYTGKPQRFWLCSLTKLEREKEKIQKEKEREIRKLNYKHSSKTKMRNKTIYQLQHYIPIKNSNVNINPEFLPLFTDVDKKLFSFKSALTQYKNACSRSLSEKHIVQIQMNINEIITEEMFKNKKLHSELQKNVKDEKAQDSRDPQS